jgi:hypothetical protein
MVANKTYKIIAMVIPLLTSYIYFILAVSRVSSRRQKFIRKELLQELVCTTLLFFVRLCPHAIKTDTRT